MSSLTRGWEQHLPHALQRGIAPFYPRHGSTEPPGKPSWCSCSSYIWPWCTRNRNMSIQARLRTSKVGVCIATMFRLSQASGKRVKHIWSGLLLHTSVSRKFMGTVELQSRLQWSENRPSCQDRRISVCGIWNLYRMCYQSSTTFSTWPRYSKHIF